MPATPRRGIPRPARGGRSHGHCRFYSLAAQGSVVCTSTGSGPESKASPTWSASRSRTSAREPSRLLARRDSREHRGRPGRRLGTDASAAGRGRGRRAPAPGCARPGTGATRGVPVEERVGHRGGRGPPASPPRATPRPSASSGRAGPLLGPLRAGPRAAPAAARRARAPRSASRISASERKGTGSAPSTGSARIGRARRSAVTVAACSGQSIHCPSTPGQRPRSEPVGAVTQPEPEREADLEHRPERRLAHHRRPRGAGRRRSGTRARGRACPAPARPRHGTRPGHRGRRHRRPARR